MARHGIRDYPVHAVHTGCMGCGVCCVRVCVRVCVHVGGGGGIVDLLACEVGSCVGGGDETLEFLKPSARAVFGSPRAFGAKPCEGCVVFIGGK